VGTDNELNSRKGATGFAGLSSLASNIDDVIARASAGSVPSDTAAPPGGRRRPVTPVPMPPPPSDPSTTPRSHLKVWLLTVGGILGVGVLIAALNSNVTSSPPPASVQSSSSAQSTNTNASLVTTAGSSTIPSSPAEANGAGLARGTVVSSTAMPSEDKPPLGVNWVLSTEQITYCLAQNIRLSGAQRALNNHESADVGRFNGMVDDYNDRCGKYQYEQGAREVAKNAVEPFRARYEQEGRSWFTPKVAMTKAVVALTPVAIRQGVQHVYTNEKRIAPFRIVTSTGQDNYFIKLVDAHTNSSVMTIYVYGGRTFETHVPLGTYRLRYATGLRWYGTKHLFGPETGYSEVDDSLTFSVQGNEVQGNDIELVPQLGGNLATKTISADEF
jgi:hypothetical protein